MNFAARNTLQAHGVLRLVLRIEWEIIEKADHNIGLLHRGTEKINRI